MKDLVARLEKANEAYRNKKPILSDEVYDALEDKLRALDPNHSFFNKTGAPVDGQWPEVQHPIPMRSLLKAQDIKGFLKWWPSQPCVITDKLDGISVGIRYVGGKLTQALTRGDGEIGSNITRNVLLMKGLPHFIQVDEEIIYVRGEIICRKSDFAKYFPDESNPRNTAGGTAKRQSDPEKCRHLTVVSYQYLPDGEALSSKRLELLELDRLGFTTTPYTCVSTPEEAISLREEFISSLREERDWEIDGLVVEIDDRDAREALGEKKHRPAGAIAYKFPHEQRVTILRNIVWQVGRSGRVTPVAVFDMVVFAGAEVKRASLHNLDRIAELCQEAGLKALGQDDEILVSRRNDVIPFVEAVIEGIRDRKVNFVFSQPTACPECFYPLQRDGAYLVCPNTLGCQAQVSGAIKRWVDKLGLKFFGETLIDTLCEQGYLNGIADLYRLDPDHVASLEMNGRKVGSSSERGFKSLRANMDLHLHVFVGSLGIPLIGRSMAQTIVDGGYDTLDKLLAATVSDLAAIPMVGGAKARSFVSGLAQLHQREVLGSLLSVGITIKDPSSGAMKGISICMSGFRDKDMVKEIESQGGIIKSSVGKTLDFLVLKDPSSTSGKAGKARKYGVAVVGIEEMWDKLGGRP